MKYSTLYFALAVFAAAGLQCKAETRSFEAMRAAAMSVLQKPGMSRVRATGEVASPQLLSAKTQMSVIGYQDGAYAVIANDDQLPAVLGYSDTPYAEAYDNPTFVNYIETLDGYLNYCAANDIAPRFIHKAVTLGHPDGVPKIMTCRWDQGAPYFNMCPFVLTNNGYSRSITGCVATALSQILYSLHKNFGTEITLHGVKRYNFSTDLEKNVPVTLNFSDLKLDWDNMLDTYSGNSGTYEQNMAVARLMYACGVAASMQYSTGASGAYASTAKEGINTFFDGVESTYSGYGIENYYQQAYDELDAGRAILVTGADKDGKNGHAFVADGYDAEGRVHLNFGWSGVGDSYFLLADMGGYTTYQTFNFIFPSDKKTTFSTDAPLSELRDKYLSVDMMHPAESIEEGRWYALYNVGRSCLVHSTGLGKTIQNTGYVPSGDESALVAPLVVRFIRKGTTGSSYYIQTGTGDYFGGLTNGGNTGTIEGQTKYYTSGRIQSKKTQKYFWFKQAGTTMDCNAVGGNGLAGWTTDTPTDTLGNNSWQLLPVTIGDDPGVAAADKTFDENHTYRLRNYDGVKNYYFFFKQTCAMGSTGGSKVVFTPDGDGWLMGNKDNDAQVFSVKDKLFKGGDGTTRSDVPLRLHFEPLADVPNTGDEAVDAHSAFYNIRCEAGYLGTTSTALGGSIFVNLTPDSANGNVTSEGKKINVRWLVTDETALEEFLSGVVGVVTETDRPTTVYDLQGRRVTTVNRGFYIQNGKKTIR